MSTRGFTLIEVLIVILLMGTLTGIGTFAFSQYTRKSQLTNQTRDFYVTLMEYRSRAFYEKKNWTFKISATGYGIYSSSNVTVSPVTTVTFNKAVEFSNATDVIYDAQGFANVTDKTVCAAGANDAVVDSVIISRTLVQIGKRQQGEACEKSKIVAQ